MSECLDTVLKDGADHPHHRVDNIKVVHEQCWDVLNMPRYEFSHPIPSCTILEKSASISSFA